ncbi:amino acid permease-domain-containing protein [Mucidula mucida]|nr:amino acid permease-domain-containing protein [Mucidula mucida]
MDWDAPPNAEADVSDMEPWIAIEPIQRPSMAVPSRFLNLSNDFEFAGWGSVVHTKLTAEDELAGKTRVTSLREQKVLGQYTATALAGNAVLGSVFYALPAVAAVASVYSPISLFTAALALFLWRPIMEELGSALPITGAPYSYILNVSTKSFALIGASLLLLDFASTAVVSAATAASYLSAEVALPFPSFVGAIIVLVLFTIISLSGMKESARLALAVLSLHIGSMVALIVASAVHWGRIGNAQLEQNWHTHSASSGSDIAHQIFNGFCLGMLGLTGFECTPSYIAKIKPGRFPLVLRNLHIPAIMLNFLVMTLLMAVVPMEKVLAAENVLSLLAEVSGGRWLRIWVVVDAIIVLCGGVLTGIVSACELFEQLAHDRVLPAVFITPLPLTGAPYISVLSFIGFSGLVYATTGASLAIMSKMFSLVWLTVMALFPISLLVLKFNRGRLPRSPHTPLTVVLLTLALSPTVFAGNIAIDPSTAGYFCAYFFAIVILFAATQNKAKLLGTLYWLYDQYPLLHRWKLSRMWGSKLITKIAKMKRKTVCVLVKSDEINHIFHMIMYVRRNEETSYLKIVHFVDEERGVPSELEANAKILDEAFPEITIDLLMVHSPLEPSTIAALAHQLAIPPSLMFISCPGAHFPYAVGDLGTRIITR